MTRKSLPVVLFIFFLLFLFKKQIIFLVKQQETGRVAATPPMGWNGWNKFRCNNANEKLIKETTDALIKNGMKEISYQYIVIDDCWQSGRNKDGIIIVDKKRFPGGMKALADYIHLKGLKFGIYTSAGRKTCENRPGSYGYEKKDLETYFSWGVDYLKLDWCGVEGLKPKEEYQKWEKLLKKYNQPLVFSISDFGIDKPWEWKLDRANMWRMTFDIGDNWESINQNLEIANLYSGYSGPGGWNDADMLQVGNGLMTANEYRAHFSLWALISSPLFAGNDLRKMSLTTKNILTNPEVIAVNQDILGLPAKIIWSDNQGHEVWVKKLSKSGEYAVVLFNRSLAEKTMTINFKDLGLVDFALVRDLWERKNKGVKFKTYAAPVSSHGIVMLKITGISIPEWLKKK